MADDIPPDTPTPHPREGSPWLAWLALWILLTAALTLACVHLPPSFKKLGLFAVAYGLLAGWTAARLKFLLDPRPTRIAAWTVLVSLVVLAGEIGLAVESARVRGQALSQTLLLDPASAAALRKFDAQILTSDPKSRESAAAIRQSIERSLQEHARRAAERQSFGGYLRYRVSDLGPRAEGLAIAIWVGEIVAGSLAGAWFFRRIMSRKSGRLETAPTVAKLDA
jgi:hypothetical protein